MKTSTEGSKPKFGLAVHWPLWLLTCSVGGFVFFAVLDMAEAARAVGLAAWAAAAIASGVELARRAAIAFLEFWKRLFESRGEPTCDIRLCIVSQAEASGVQGVYTRFTPQGEGEREIWAALEKQLKKRTGQFRVLGVAGPCLFQDLHAVNLFNYHMPSSDTTVRAILLDRKCAWADVRDRLEQSHLTRNAIGTSLKHLDYMKSQWGRRVEYQTTDIPLPAFVVITDEWAFVEPYPIVEVNGQIGGRTPLLKLEVDSTGYNIWRDTFELLWTYPRLEDLRKHARAPAR